MTALELMLEWRKKRLERIAHDKEGAAMKEIEDGLKTQLIGRLKKLANKSVSNGERLVQLVEKDEPTVTDWPTLYNHIKKTGEFELLERRLGKAAVKDRWELKIKVPGVGSIPVETLSDTQAK
jgi:hypothetical protein